MPEVGGFRTPLSLPEVAHMLCEAYRLELHARPTGEEIAMATGIIAAENDNGKAIVEHNYGNISAGPNWRAKKSYWLAPSAVPGQPVAFRAYETHMDGARAFWNLLYDEEADRYRHLTQILTTGDPFRVAEEMYSAGYIRGPPGVEAYGRNIASGASKVAESAELATCRKKPGQLENRTGAVVAGASLLGLLLIIATKGKRKNARRQPFAA